MRAFIERTYGVSADEAEAVRQLLIAEHGTTLHGLMVTKGVDPVEFLTWEHQLDFSGLTPDPLLRAALAQHDDSRYVFTNGTAEYGRRVLRLLELDDLFDGVWGIDCGDYLPKPWPEAYRRCFAGLGIDPAGGIFFDDAAINLEVPKRLGMITVLVSPFDEHHDHVDQRVPDLLTWLSRPVE